MNKKRKPSYVLTTLGQSKVDKKLFELSELFKSQLPDKYTRTKISVFTIAEQTGLDRTTVKKIIRTHQGVNK
ncbi:MAG: hypothetical protein QNJ68_01390 [Microcoleaceae cyanobacterium MO_207.B10]|nr:hypothetical protein [Microcoleaceae cyanobacterium MO_207.B10]